ncbi:hypothetical protein FS837_006004 [Tulasnella sp. UAMH 9824]|nr:hypothetical protein FS837_006004 [Tulasnella sp. UAMH 9824]
MVTDVLDAKSTHNVAKRSEALSFPHRTSHILSLPYDILYLIFTQVVHNKHDFPVVISHVCRYWRRYAFDTPSFWTSLKFRKSIPEIEKYRTWLERSKDTPFDLEIGWEPFTGASIKHVKAIIRLIFPHVQRLRSLRVVEVPFKIRQVIFDRLNNVHLPSLETLHVERGWTDDEKPALTDRKFKPFHHGDATNLKHIVLKGIPYNYVIHRFTNLKTLSITSRNIFGSSHHDNAKAVQHILSLSPDLRSLHISRDDFSKRTSKTLVQPPSIHSSLEELVLSGPVEDVNAIVCASVLPSLRRLYIQPGTNLPIGISCLPTMAQARPDYPYPNLLALRLLGRQTYDMPHSTADALNMEFFEKALKGLPQLQSLTLELVDLENNKHVRCLTRTCPRLKRLEFVRCSGLTLKELKAMIQIRRDSKSLGSSSLEYMHVFDSVSEIQRLQEEAKEHGLEEGEDFTVMTPSIFTNRIVIICKE